MIVLKWRVVLAAVGYLGGVAVLFFAQRALIFPAPQTTRTAPADSTSASARYLSTH